MQLARQEITEAHERTQRILQLKRAGGRIIFALGYELKLIKEDYEMNPQRALELYGYPNFIQYHSQPGIAYSVTSTNRFIRLYETYVVKFGVSEDDPNLKAIDYTVLDSMIKFIDKNNVDDWLRRAASMGRRDLALTIHNKGEEPECNHVAVDIWEVETCRKCGDEVGKRKVE
jgi:hypothetical protein